VTIDISPSFIHVRVRNPHLFSKFRTKDVGRPGHTKIIVGKLRTGNWTVQKYLLSRKDFDVKGKGMFIDFVPKNLRAKKVARQIKERHNIDLRKVPMSAVRFL